MALLQVENISSGYGEVQILWDVSVHLEQGKLTALVGSNGAGKTTLLRTVVGLVKAWQGSVHFDGQNVTRHSAHAKATEGLVLVPEGRQLFTEMSVYENLEMGAFGKRAKAHFRDNLEKVYEMLPRLKERANQKAGTLSGGEQQMLAVGRGLMAQPSFSN
jgi:branched-chain amino acid transport system ATP-binding protein